MNEIPLDAPVADVVDQRTEVVPSLLGEDETAPARPALAADVPWDADPADVAEQLAEVPLDDDWA